MWERLCQMTQFKHLTVPGAQQVVGKWVIGILFLNSLEERWHLPHLHLSLLTLPLLCAEHTVLHRVEAQTDWAPQQTKAQRGGVSGPRLHRQPQRKIKEQALELILGASHPRWASWGQWCQVGVIQQLGALQNLGTGPQQGQEPGARALRGSPAGAEVAAGAASWARVMLVPGKPGGTRLLRPRGVL